MCMGVSFTNIKPLICNRWCGQERRTIFWAGRLYIQSQSANIFISWEYKINQNSHYERYAHIKHKTCILKDLIGTIFIQVRVHKYTQIHTQFHNIFRYQFVIELQHLYIKSQHILPAKKVNIDVVLIEM